MKNFFNRRKKIIFILFLIIAISLGVWKYLDSKNQAPEYQTSKVEKGNLVTTVSASGTISTGNNANITTSATGTVNTVYVQNGDYVTKGQKIADITLDQDSEQKQTSAWSSYLSAKNSLDAANAKMNSLQAAAFKANQAFINDAVERELKTDDPTYIQENATWLQSEADYKNQLNVINQSQAALNSAWISYQQTASSIAAPMDGIVSNLSIAPGAQITSSNSSNSNTSIQTLGSIKMPNSNIQATVDLSEVDVTKVMAGQQATMTLDAFPDKTFTGKVLLVNTNGSVSSSVTTYPATISFDTSLDTIYPNMAVSATIITNIKENVLLVPSLAIQTSNNQSTVRVLKEGKVTSVVVETGDSNDTQTEITSGLSEGDTIVTSISNQSGSTGSQGTSVFSGSNRNFGGGGSVRIMRGGGG